MYSTAMSDHETDPSYLCRRDHDRPLDGCDVCDVRASQVFCGDCGTEHADGQWWPAACTGQHLRHPVGALVDGFGRPIRCEVPVTICLLDARGCCVDHKTGVCPDPVTEPGRSRCDWHHEIHCREELSCR